MEYQHVHNYLNICTKDHASSYFNFYNSLGMSALHNNCKIYVKFAFIAVLQHDVFITLVYLHSTGIYHAGWMPLLNT